MKKVADLIGAELDFYVAKAEGWTAWIVDGECWTNGEGGGMVTYKPSYWWEDGGPIIQSEIIQLKFHYEEQLWEAYINDSDDDYVGVGDTPLIAAMRAYVASKFGSTVPDEARTEQ